MDPHVPHTVTVTSHCIKHCSCNYADQSHQCHVKTGSVLLSSDFFNICPSKNRFLFPFLPSYIHLYFTSTLPLSVYLCSLSSLLPPDKKYKAFLTKLETCCLEKKNKTTLLMGMQTNYWISSKLIAVLRVLACRALE